MNDMTGIRVRLFAYLFVLFIFSFVALFGITYSLVDREHLTLEEEFVIKNTKQLQKATLLSLSILSMLFPPLNRQQSILSLLMKEQHEDHLNLTQTSYDLKNNHFPIL